MFTILIFEILEEDTYYSKSLLHKVSRQTVNTNFINSEYFTKSHILLIFLSGLKKFMSLSRESQFKDYGSFLITKLMFQFRTE